MGQKQVSHSKCIGINTLFLVPGEVGGTEYHLRSFLSELEKQDTQNQYVIFCNEENAGTFSFNNPLWQKKVCPVKATNRLARLIYEQTQLPFLARSSGCQLLHSFGYWGTVLNLVPQVLTVHDTNWLDHPEDMTFLTRWLTKLLTETTMRHAVAIMTDSDFARDRLNYYFPQYTTKVSVIVPGIDAEFVEKVKHAQQLRSPIPQPYFLCVSALYPHKNIPQLLQLWEEVTRTSETGSLVLIGRRGLDESKVQQQLTQLKRIVYQPQVKFADLANLYAHASSFIFPSQYEGFGYPVYEALLADLPCFVSQKQLYQPDIRKFLTELTGNRTKDAQSLIRSLTTAPRASARHIKNSYSYQLSAQQLLLLYAKL